VFVGVAVVGATTVRVAAVRVVAVGVAAVGVAAVGVAVVDNIDVVFVVIDLLCFRISSQLLDVPPWFVTLVLCIARLSWLRRVVVGAVGCCLCLMWLLLFDVVSFFCGSPILLDSPKCETGTMTRPAGEDTSY
jgi:hypothetical protein